MTTGHPVFTHCAKRPEESDLNIMLQGWKNILRDDHILHIHHPVHFILLRPHQQLGAGHMFGP